MMATTVMSTSTMNDDDGDDDDDDDDGDDDDNSNDDDNNNNNNINNVPYLKAVMSTIRSDSIALLKAVTMNAATISSQQGRKKTKIQ